MLQLFCDGRTQWVVLSAVTQKTASMRTVLNASVCVCTQRRLLHAPTAISGIAVWCPSVHCGHPVTWLRGEELVNHWLDNCQGCPSAPLWPWDGPQ